MPTCVRLVLFALLFLASASATRAQSLGQFRWQLTPFCNIVTLAVTQSAGVFRVEGVDDQCGGSKAASASGTAFLNPDGSIGFGLAIVASPSGIPVHLEASISLSTLSGTWHDSAGNTGNFVFTPGNGTGGTPRPLTTLGLSGVSMGFGLLASGAPGNVQVDVNLEQVKDGLSLRTPGEGSLALGSDALSDVESNAAFNTAIGALALSSLIGTTGNTAVGASALANLTFGADNTAVGRGALGNLDSGGANVAIGASSAAGARGRLNVAIGTNAFSKAGAGERNVVIGYGALLDAGMSNTIAIGAEAGVVYDSDNNNNIAIGSPGHTSDANTIRIGSSHTRTFIAGISGQTVSNAVGVFVNGTGILGTLTSSARFKEEISPIGDVREQVQGLRPVRFVYTPDYDDGARTPQFGLIAEDVARTFPELVVRDEDGRPWTVRYHLLTPLLLAEVQRLERERSTLVEQLNQQQSRLDALERQLTDVIQGVMPPVTRECSAGRVDAASGACW